MGDRELGNWIDEAISGPAQDEDEETAAEDESDEDEVSEFAGDDDGDDAGDDWVPGSSTDTLRWAGETDDAEWRRSGWGGSRDFIETITTDDDAWEAVRAELGWPAEARPDGRLSDFERDFQLAAAALGGRPIGPDPLRRSRPAPPRWPG
jgi:hypothetical protein